MKTMKEIIQIHLTKKNRFELTGSRRNKFIISF